jgi:hypothetical protein
MSAIKRKKKWLKETILVKEGKTRLIQHNNYGWTLVDYLHTPRNKPKCSEWNCFVKIFLKLLENVQKLILKKLHGVIEV